MTEDLPDCGSPMASTVILGVNTRSEGEEMTMHRNGKKKRKKMKK
jgi:hypothetical protein